MATGVAAVLNPHMKMYDGQPLEVGQVFQMRSQLNDDKLIGNNYVKLLKREDTKHFDKCLRCGVTFADESYTKRHQRTCPQEVIDLDGPALKRPRHMPGAEINPDGDSDVPLEPDGGPTAPRLEETGIAGSDPRINPAAVTRGNGGAGRQAKEIIHLA